MSSQIDVSDHLRSGKGPRKALNGKLDFSQNQRWTHREKNIT